MQKHTLASKVLIALFFASLLASSLLVFNAKSANGSGTTIIAVTPANVNPLIVTNSSGDVTVNATAYAITFYGGTAGYNEYFYGNGSVMIQNDQIVLQYLANSNWKQRGTAQSINYTIYDSHHVEVDRYFYDAATGTNYWVQYSMTNRGVKISVLLNNGNSADTYQIEWSPSGISQTNYVNTTNTVVFGTGPSAVTFNWTDVYSTFGNITTYSVSSVAQGRKLDAVFSIGAVAANQTLTVDPTVTTGSVGSFSMPTAGYISECTWSGSENTEGVGSAADLYLETSGGSVLSSTSISFTSSEAGSWTVSPQIWVTSGETLQLAYTQTSGNIISMSMAVVYTPYYAITASADSNSAITPSGTVYVASGNSEQFSYSANSGYEISSVLVDGSSVSDTGSYTFSSVSAGHTISVTSELIPTTTSTPAPVGTTSPTPTPTATATATATTSASASPSTSASASTSSSSSSSNSNTGTGGVQGQSQSEESQPSIVPVSINEATGNFVIYGLAVVVAIIAVAFLLAKHAAATSS